MKFARTELDWVEELSGAVTVCDTAGIIVYMNKVSIGQFAAYGGEELIGTNLLDCHPEPSRTKLQEMLKTPTENVYNTEKNGKKKIIVQKPWMQNGDFRGVVELSFELASEMPHFVRK